MRPGRPLAWQILSSDIQLLSATLDGRGRFHVSSKIRDGLEWLQASRPILAALELGGRIRLLPWVGAESVRNRLQTLTNQLTEEDAEKGADDLVILKHYYERLALDESCRIQLPDHVSAHLHATSGGVIFIARLVAHVELWSDE